MEIGLEQIHQVQSVQKRTNRIQIAEVELVLDLFWGQRLVESFLMRFDRKKRKMPMKGMGLQKT